MTGPAVETRGLSKRFGEVVAVDDLSLSVPTGSVFGLLGPNGAGKTTLIGLLLGLISPSDGDHSLLGIDATEGGDDLIRRVGAAMETPSFYPHLSGRANLRFFQGIGGGGSAAEVDRLLALVGLADRAESKFATYSLGMRHRLGIAYAMLHDPDLLLLDEPTNGLDPSGMAEVRALIAGLADGRRTVVLASHLLAEVQQVCDHVAILSRGRVVVQGEVATLLEGAGTVALRTTDDEKAVTVLSALPWVHGVTRSGGRIAVPTAADRSWELTAALSAAGVHVAEMTVGERSLEDYFIAVTGEEAGQ